MADKTYALLTVDTEATLYKGKIIPPSQLIYGEIDGDYYGIPKIMDMLDNYGFKATFFVDVFEYKQFGEKEIQHISLLIHNRGHDVQLHTHPIWAYDQWAMTDFTLAEQTRIIEDGSTLIYKWLGKHPVAHRAGAFAADHNTLRALQANQIPIDSSMCLGYPSCKLDRLPLKKSAVDSLEGVLEVPLTVFAELKIGPYARYRCLDVDACTLAELKHVIKQAKNKGLRFVTICMHSFSLVKCNKDWTQFSPDEVDIKKFKGLLDFLKNEPDIEVITMRDCYRQLQDNPSYCAGEDYIPNSGYYRTLMRAFRYFNKSAKNKIFVLSSLALFVAVLFGILLLLSGLLFKFD